ncbi:MAG: thioredoxin family protein [Pseudanabaena sp. ELA645]
MNKNLLPRRRFLTYMGLGTLGIGSASCAAQFGSNTATTLPSTSDKSTDKSNSAEIKPVATNIESNVPKLPEFQGISQWLNSNPLTIQDLKGNVVLIQFWTFSCINCQRTLPYVTKWHQQYAAKGLKIIGVHTPEFAFERDPNNIKEAMQKHGILYPVPIDNEFKTWKAYKNEYWPHLYLADRQGNLQYDHIGEGAYAKTEQTIQKLLG